MPDLFGILKNMWNDEDNNPYGAFDQHESRLSDSLHSAAISPRKLSPILGRWLYHGADPRQLPSSMIPHPRPAATPTWIRQTISPIRRI